MSPRASREHEAHTDHVVIDVREAFLEAADAFAAEVARLDAEQLGARGTDEWSVLELVGHTSRAMLTIETAIAAPFDPSARRLAGAGDYFRVVLSMPGVHAGITNRARASTAELGADPASFVAAALVRVRPVVERTPLDRVVQHAAGQLTFGEYLRTRTFELVLHTADLHLALGWPVTAPRAAAIVTRDLALELADLAEPVLVACALTGRRTDPSCSVLR